MISVIAEQPLPGTENTSVIVKKKSPQSVGNPSVERATTVKLASSINRENQKVNGNVQRSFHK